MSKKHFIALADALRQAKPDSGYGSARLEQWKADVGAISAVCASSNPRFNYPRWIGYIMGGENGPSGGKLKAA